ncbi:MAG: hypothetical protein WCN98_16780, partial [Verrucomicrobiaceae bacterium]
MKTPTRRMSLNWIFALSILVGLHRPVGAEFMQPELVPVDRLIKSAEAKLAKNPADANAQYTLARIHYLAFHIKYDQAPAFMRDGDGEPAPQWMLGWGTNEKNLNEKRAVKLKDEAMIDHAAKALKGFNEALVLDPKNGLYALGLASLLEEFSTWKESSKPTSVPVDLNNITLTMLREAYGKALSLALPEDSKLKHQPISGIESLTSHESATALVRLASKADLDEAGK